MKPTASSTYLPAALGSALGAVARYAISALVLSLQGPGFPWGTLTVNVAGSLLIGFFASLLATDGRFGANHAMRQLILAGFCGGFTTFSIFSLEVLLLLSSGEIGRAVTYLLLSLVLWLAAVWAGFRMGSFVHRLVYPQ